MDDPRIIQALEARNESPDNKSIAARAAGSTLQSYRRALDYIEKHEEKPELPIFPDDDIEADEILDHMGKRFRQRLQRDQALQWFPVKMQTDKPIGLAIVGDPHIGSDGCNVPLLRRDVALMAETPGIHAVNIGDTVDNWSDRLIHLYSENNVSRQTERRLARWFLQESGVPWLIWMLGNHDLMAGEFSTYLKTIATIPVLDWSAKFELQFPGGRVCRVDLAHNHKGTSIYNPVHGQKRRALWSGGEMADIIAAGHHHVAAAVQEETSDGRIITLARARGYKWLDHFAVTHGFDNNQHGATILFVIDPCANNAVKFVQPFLDLEAGCEYLTHMREK